MSNWSKRGGRGGGILIMASRFATHGSKQELKWSRASRDTANSFKQQHLLTSRHFSFSILSTTPSAQSSYFIACDILVWRGKHLWHQTPCRSCSNQTTGWSTNNNECTEHRQDSEGPWWIAGLHIWLEHTAISIIPVPTKITINISKTVGFSSIHVIYKSQLNYKIQFLNYEKNCKKLGVWYIHFHTNSNLNLQRIFYTSKLGLYSHFTHTGLCNQ